MTGPMISGALALTAAVCYGMSNFFGGLASRRTSAMSAVIWMELAGVIPALGATAVTTGHLSAAAVANGLAIGIFAGAGLVCFYRALSMGAMAIAAPVVGAISAAIPVVIGLATSEHVHTLQLAGLVAAVIALPMIGFQGGRSGSPRGIVYAVIAGVLLGVNFLFIKDGQSGGAWTAVAARCSVATFVAMVAAGSRSQVVPARSSWLLVASAGLLDTLGFILLVFAYRGGSLSVTTVLASLNPAITVLLGWLILRERLRTGQRFGVALGLVAVGLIGTG